VPGEEAANVVAHALACQLEALGALLHRREDEALHAERLARLGKLLEDGIGRLEAELVLLRLVLQGAAVSACA
jgi:hypothetical protein